MIHDDGKLKSYNNGPLTALYFIILITIIIITVIIFKMEYWGNLVFLRIHGFNCVQCTCVCTPVTKVREGGPNVQSVW